MMDFHFKKGKSIMDKKTEIIIFKLTKEEKELLKKLARNKHLSVSSYIRYKCFNIVESNED